MNEINLIVLGEIRGGVGKSCIIIIQYIENKFYKNYLSLTIGTGRIKKDLTIDGKKITLNIFNTGGTSNFYIYLHALKNQTFS